MHFSFFTILRKLLFNFLKSWLKCFVTSSNITKKSSTLSRRRSLAYRNQSIYLQTKSMDWFLYDRQLRHKDLNTTFFTSLCSTSEMLLTHFSPLLYFYNSLKTSQNQRFSDVFRGYRNGEMAWKGLYNISDALQYSVI